MVLVTGASGQVGIHLLRALSAKGIETVTTTLFAFVPTLLEAASFLAEDFCIAKNINIKFTENNTIQIWLDNADEYSLCD